MFSHFKNRVSLVALVVFLVAGLSYVGASGGDTSEQSPSSQHASSATTPNQTSATKERACRLPEPIVLRHHRANVSRCRFFPDSDKAITLGNDGTARIWDAKDGTLLRTLRGHSAFVTNVDISRDGRLVATSARDGSARLWDAATGRSLFTFPGGRVDNSAVQFSLDSSKLLIGKSDGEVSTWDTSTGEQIRHYCNTSYVSCLEDAYFVLDGKYVLANNAKEEKIFIWDEANGQLAKELKTSGINYATTITPDGKKVLAGGDEGHLWQWDYETGESDGHKSAHFATIVRLSFSPNGQLFLTGSLDGYAKMWDYKTGKVLQTLHHGDGVITAVFSPDGKTVLTASYDWTARLWDVESGRLLRELNTHSGDLHQAAYSPDGKKIITASEDTTAHIHTL